MTHDPDADGNLFAWVLALAANRRQQLMHQAQSRVAHEAALARKFHELPADGRAPIVLASTPSTLP